MRPVDPTTSDLQAQIDRLSLTVQMGRESKGSLEPATQQLARLAERCNEILTRWADADVLHAQIVNEAEMRLTEWGAIENRLEEDYAKRLRHLEEAIGLEWQALRRIHEEPVKQLRQEAAALSEVAVSAATLALQGFERAETRLTTLEANLQMQLSRLSEDVHTALADHRRELAVPALPEANVTPFPLEGVMRIHDDLRQDPPDRARVTTEGSLAIVAREAPEAAAMLSARVESLEREVTIERQEVHDTANRAEQLGRTWRVAIGALVLAILGAAIAGIIAQRSMNARLNEASARVAAAERQAQAAATAANQQIAATRADAERQIAQARQTALEAGIVGSVLAAPDLVRFSLVGTDRAPRAYAQVLWSRSRGLVLSASQLPPTTDGAVYHVWLLSESGAASAGSVTSDASGRASLAIENPPNLPRAVNGVSVTLESGAAASSPSPSLVLVRIQQ